MVKRDNKHAYYSFEGILTFLRNSLLNHHVVKFFLDIKMSKVNMLYIKILAIINIKEEL